MGNQEHVIVWWLWGVTGHPGVTQDTLGWHREQRTEIGAVPRDEAQIVPGSGHRWRQNLSTLGDPTWTPRQYQRPADRDGCKEMSQEKKVGWVSGKRVLQEWESIEGIGPQGNGGRAFAWVFYGETGHTTNKCTAGKNQTMARKWIKRVSKTISRSNFCEEKTMTSALDLWCYHWYCPTRAPSPLLAWAWS